MNAVLPRPARLRSANQFRFAVRHGVRSGRPTLVVHAFQPDGSTGNARVGFIVAKAVGPAVVRNRVKRRLRHLVRPYLESAPEGTDMVVRALPRAATHPSELAGDLEQAWRRGLTRLARSARQTEGERP